MVSVGNLDPQPLKKGQLRPAPSKIQCSAKEPQATLSLELSAGGEAAGLQFLRRGLRGFWDLLWGLSVKGPDARSPLSSRAEVSGILLGRSMSCCSGPPRSPLAQALKIRSLCLKEAVAESGPAAAFPLSNIFACQHRKACLGAWPQSLPKTP